MIIILSILFINDSEANIVTIAFSSLIIIELLNVYTQIKNLSLQMLLIYIETGVVYFMNIVILQEYFDTSYFDSVLFVKIGIIAMINWAPLLLIYWIGERCNTIENKLILMDE